MKYYNNKKGGKKERGKEEKELKISAQNSGRGKNQNVFNNKVRH